MKLSNMFDKMKKELYFSRMQLLLKKGIEDGSIVPFGEKFYQKMNHTYLYMFFALQMRF